MTKHLTDNELAEKLCSNQVDGVFIEEAAKRLNVNETRHLLTAVDIASAIHSSPLVDARTSQVIEKIILSVPMSRRSSKRLSSLAERILAGDDYTREDVLSLAASVMSQTT